MAPIIASVGQGIDHLRGQILRLPGRWGAAEWPKRLSICFAELPALVSEEVEKIAVELQNTSFPRGGSIPSG